MRNDMDIVEENSWRRRESKTCRAGATTLCETRPYRAPARGSSRTCSRRLPPRPAPCRLEPPAHGNL